VDARNVIKAALWSTLTLACLGVCTTVCLAATAPATSKINAGAGPIKATLYYHAENLGLPERHLDRIEVFWHGREAFAGSLPENFTDAYPFDPKQPVIEAVDLNADGTPEIVVHTFTGGAHCCIGSVIYGYDPKSKHIAHLARDWQSGGYLLKDVDGHHVLISDDQRFAYAFASYAGSGEPIQIWAYAPVKLSDVTRCFPRLIHDDARRWWDAAEQEKREPYPETLGLLAAYAADEYLLGERAKALSAIAHFDQQVTPSYLDALQKFLRENGYESTQRPACP
jgi:hypothetical protein